MNYSAESINKYIYEGKFDELIEISEKRHKDQFKQLRTMIREANKNVISEQVTEAVYITGPSSSGKTTFGHLVADMLREDDYECTVISFDNYYKDREEIQKLQNAKGFLPTEESDYDYETIDAFDVDFFRKQMNEYMSGKEIVLPKYDFTIGKRVQGDVALHPAKKDMLIIEGIHALNPALRTGVGFMFGFNVYICPFDFFGADSNEQVIRPQEIRFMRRVVRDRVMRAASINRTMEMWPNVRSGEEKYIKPMKAYADFFFNSSLEYEISYLKKKIFEMKDSMDEQSVKLLEKFIPLKTLEHFESYDGFNIPSDSIFNEFYKG